MNKTQLIAVTARRTTLSLEVVQRVVDALFDEDGVIQGELVDGNAVALRGFGTFEPKTRKARVTKHPTTGEPIQLPPTIVAGFKPAGRLRDKMRG